MEVEIKLHVLPSVPGGPAALFEQLAAMERLAGVPLGNPAQLQVRDIYYDTADGALARAGAGLRLRLEDSAALVTLKVNRRQEGALTAREEYEEPLAPESLERVLAHAGPLMGAEPVPYGPFAQGDQAGPLRPVLVVHTARLARQAENLAVLTLDRVEYPGLDPQPYWDIEVESLSGKAGEPFLREAEQELNRLAGGELRPATISKLERGLRLHLGQRT